MKKKYIIEIDDDRNIIRNCGKTMLTVSIAIGKTAGSINTGIELTPYTEPDLEQIRKEAYKEGREDGIHDGMCDVWEAARKIYLPVEYDGILADRLHQIFGNKTTIDIFKELSASEIVEKIRQYEQEKEFKVGNEFENESGKKFVILKMNGKEIDRYMDDDGNTYHMNVKYKVMRKTGRTFPEVAIVLEKMREGQK